MALATQCPHCHTTFRVVHDQLKLRAGLVRCGSCKQIFNGIEHLLRPDQVGAVPAKKFPDNAVPQTVEINPIEEKESSDEPAEESANAEFAPDNSIVITEADESISEDQSAHPPLPVSVQTSSDPAESEPVSSDPLQRMTLMDFTQVEEDGDSNETEQEPALPPASGSKLPEALTDANVPDELELAIEDLQKKPWRSANKSSSHDSADDLVAAEADEPDFVTQGRRRQRLGRAVRIAIWTASGILLLALLGQTTYLFRNQLGAWFPQVKPALSGACSLINCQVTLPMQIDAVSIESSELQALVPQKNTFALTILLRNYSATAQAWPNIELTLSDANEKALVRRVFAPRDYLSPKQDLTKGFAANSEQPVKIPFELLQLKASGYRVYVFYP